MYNGDGTQQAFDTEGKIWYYGDQSGQIASYVWDALSNRIERNVTRAPLNALLNYVDGTRTTNGFGPNYISTTDLSLGGVHVNTYVGTTTTYFNHQDHLGDTRTQTDPNGSTNNSYFKTLPFGEWNASNLQGNDLFAGDSLLESVDSYMYQMPFRRYDEYTGQWQSPDPAGMAAVDIANPQTWNRYAYVMNNPVSYVDPLGLFCGVNDYGLPPKIKCRQGDTLDWGGYAFPSYTYQWVDNTYVNTTIWYGYDDSGNSLGMDPHFGQIGGGYWALTGVDLTPLQFSFDTPANNFSWWGTFAKSFFGDFSFRGGTRQQGQTWSQCVDSAQQALLGNTGTVVLNATSLVGPLATKYTTPQMGPTDIPGVSVSMSDWERDAFFNAGAGADNYALASKATGVASNVFGVVTAVATGIKGGFYVACAH